MNNKLAPFVVFSIIIVAFITTFNPLFSQFSRVDNLPEINRYARVGVDSLPIVAPDGFLLLVEGTKPDYNWFKTDIVSETLANDFRIKDIFTCSLPCDKEIVSSKSVDGTFVDLFTTTMKTGQTLVYIEGDIHRGSTLVHNGVVVTPTLVATGNGWEKYVYTTDHDGLFNVQHPETRFGFYEVVNNYVVTSTTTPTSTAIIKPTVTNTPEPTSTPGSVVTSVPVTIVTPTSLPSPTPTVVFELPTVEPTPIANLYGDCRQVDNIVELVYFTSESCEVSIMRNNVPWLTSITEIGNNVFYDQFPLLGDNNYIVDSTCGETVMATVEYFCYMAPPTDVDETQEPTRRRAYMSIVFR